MCAEAKGSIRRCSPAPDTPSPARSRFSTPPNGNFKSTSRHAHGSVLLDKVFAHLELVERDFFGLQFLYVLGTKETQKRWLDPNKSIRKQMVCPPFHLCFRVKFYVSDPSKLVEEYTRYHFFLQLRLDMLEGRLPSAEGSLALLASYAVQ
ncbi:FERM protein, partial [Teladorsagia circumcincta]